MFNTIIFFFQVVTYTIFPFILLSLPRWFLVWIPFLPVLGIWMVSSWGIPREFYFVQSYIEFAFIIFFVTWWLISKKNRTSIYLIGFALLSIPSFLNSKGHFYLTLFLFLCLLGSAGVYTFFLDNMKKIIKRRIVDISVLTWIILGTFIRTDIIQLIQILKLGKQI